MMFKSFDDSKSNEKLIEDKLYCKYIDSEKKLILYSYLATQTQNIIVTPVSLVLKNIYSILIKSF